MESLTVHYNFTYFETRFLSSMSNIGQEARNEVNLTFFSNGSLEVT